jgi:hypothetical protein
MATVRRLTFKKEDFSQMRKLNSLLVLLIVFFLALGRVSAQSLKPEDPYPLQAGINKGTSDSLVGMHYWYFYATPGNNKVTVRFKPMTLYGAPMKNTTLTITLYDQKKTWRNAKVISPDRNQTDVTFTAENIKNKTKVLISVAPPSQNLLRMGGDYEIEATGDVQFDEVKSAADPIIRTYQSKTGYASHSYDTVKFLADGTIETSTGYRGTWKLFDRENRIYTVTMDDGFRVSVQYLPGYGLVKPDDPGIILFQELQR